MVPTHSNPKSELQSPSNSSTSPKNTATNKRKQNHTRTVFITGLSLKMKRRALIDYFRSIYPSTVNFTAKRLGANKKTPGYGFLVFGKEEEMRAALKRKTFNFWGKEIKVEPFLDEEQLKRQKQELEKRKVYVGKIPKTMNKSHLKSAMEEAFGQVERVFVIKNSTYKRRNRKGFGYVVFSSEASSKRAIEMKTLEVDAFDAVLYLEKPKDRTSSEKNQSEDSNQKQGQNSELNPSSRIPRAGTHSPIRMSPPLPDRVNNNNPNPQVHPGPNYDFLDPVGFLDSEPSRDYLDPKNYPSQHLPLPISTRFKNEKQKPFKSQNLVGKINQSSNKTKKRGPNKRTSAGGQFRPNPYKDREDSSPCLPSFVPGPDPQAFLRQLSVFQKGRGIPTFRYTKIEDCITKNGWKEYCLSRLDHLYPNIRINYGRPSTKVLWN